MREFQQAPPSLLPQLALESRLNFLPDRQHPRQLPFSSAGQTKPPFSSVCTTLFGNPTLSDHDRQCPRQTCTIHREHLAELTLRHFSRERQSLQDGELRRSQSQRTQRLLIKLCE